MVKSGDVVGRRCRCLRRAAGLVGSRPKMKSHSRYVQARNTSSDAEGSGRVVS